MVTSSRLLALETAAIDAELHHRQAKALRFLELVGENGQYHQAAFKQLDADPELIELEREARYARARVKVAYRELSRPWWTRLQAPNRRIDEVAQ